MSIALVYLVLAVLPAAAFWGARVGLERLASDRPVPARLRSSTGRWSAWSATCAD